jgi:cytochrome c oxidase accessory protein FixG
MKLDKMPLNAERLRKKFTKHFLWIAFALFTGFTFVGYFSPIRDLYGNIVNFALSPWEAFWIFFYAFATYGNAGWMREQVCKFMCPYARFQSAMFDKDTLIISYDEKRGEPRGSRKKGSDPADQGLGSCIDCSICVQVCPTGIDIRNGLQYECIGCAACIDACDGVMEKMGYPKGLIKYTTENSIEGKKTHVFRPRIIVYSLILMGITLATAVSIGSRSPLELDVIRDRNSLFRETDDGMIENIYTLKIINKDIVEHEYQISASGIPELKLLSGKTRIAAGAGQVVDIPVRIVVDPEYLKVRSTEVEIHLEAIDSDLSITEEARFLGPN